MINILKSELKRSIFNKWTLIAMMIIMCFGIKHFMGMYDSRMEYIHYVEEAGYGNAVNVCSGTAYEYWIMFDFNMYKIVILFIMPILSVLPFGMSYYSDVKSGYIKQIVSRMSMKTYTRAKYIATFISGGLAVTLPLFIQFLLTATIFPLHKPDRFACAMVGQYCFDVDLFYEHPMIFTLFRLMLIFVVAGLLATVSLLVSKYIYNYFSVFITPFVVSFMLEFSVYITGMNWISFSNNLRAESQIVESYTALLIEIVVLFAATYFGFVSSKKEVY